MDPTLEGALIGAGATALGSVIAWFGSRAQARAQLRSVTLQFRAQRFDVLQGARRAAYAEFLQAVERTRALIGEAHQAELDDRAEGVRGGRVVRVRADAARELLEDAIGELRRQQAMLRLSVTRQEAAITDGLTSLVLGAVSTLDGWRAAEWSNEPDRYASDWADPRLAVPQALEEIEERVEYFVQGARSYLEVIPDLEVPRESTLQRWRARRLDREWRRQVGG